MTLYIIIGGAVAASLGTLALLGRRFRKTSVPGRTPYVNALHMLLEGKNEEALELLKKTVRIDTDNIMAYIKLGDILRETGMPLRAVKIHRNLLVRPNLPQPLIEMILQHLVKDYQAAGVLGKAIEMAERLVHRNKKDTKNQQLLLSLYEEKGEWDKAFFHRQNIGKWQKKQRQEILAIYKVRAGLTLTEQGVEREGRIRFREALKLDKNCVPAYLYWGDSYRREKRNEDALRIWQDFTIKIPDWAHLAFARLKEVLFDLGRFSDIENILLQVIKKKPRNPTVPIHLAELYLKQGKTTAALEACQKALDINPKLARGHYLQIQILKQQGQEKEALNMALNIMQDEIVVEEMYSCSECQYLSAVPEWYCPQCHQWNTFLKDEEK